MRKNKDAMNVQFHGKAKGGFTLPEVILAVGIVAFGLVGVFSILPFGLTAQKKNQEDTILRYEAEYWFATLQSAGLPLESLHRVETVELLKEANSTMPYRINRFDLSTDQAAGWPADVCGWLSAPKARVFRKYAYVRAMNGSLHDRLNGLRGRSPFTGLPEYFMPGGEFSFGYILEPQVESMEPFGSRIKLTFHWPISENAGNAIKAGASINQIMVNPETRPVKSETFSTLTGLRPRPALMINNLNLNQLQFLHTGLPGDEVPVARLNELFEDRDSYKAWDFAPRDLEIANNGVATVRVGTGQKIDDYVPFLKWDDIPIPKRPLYSEAFSGNDVGWHVQIKDLDGFKTYLIMDVEPVVTDSNGVLIKNGHKIQLYLDGNPPNGAGPFPYWVTFLNPRSTEATWQSLLALYGRQGLGEVFADPNTGQDIWRFGSYHKSSALLFMTNSVGSEFSVTLTLGENSPADAPLESLACSFWFLR